MKVMLAVLFGFLLLLSSCELPNADNVELNRNPEIRGGELQSCDSDFRTGRCAEGFGCHNVTVRPYIIAVCYPLEDLNSGNFTIEEYSIDKIIEQDQGFIYEN